jgi:hypothetical protein
MLVYVTNCRVAWVGGWVGGKIVISMSEALRAADKKFSIQSAHLSNYHISLWRKVFFSVVTNFFSFILKWPTVARGHRKKCDRSRLLGTWYLTVFPQKLGTKLFIFHTKHFYGLIVLYLVLALESISGVKSWFFS